VSRFVEWQTSPARQKDLPSTKDILEQLTGNKGQPSAPVKLDNDGPLTDKVKAIVEQELGDFRKRIFPAEVEFTIYLTERA
jgi:hypothetical protein